MSHRLYHTEGLILSRHHYGEANVLFRILSPDLGLVGVSAQGARYLKSKLRAQLQTLDHVRLTLVRGREVWRLTGAETTGVLDSVRREPEKLQVWARIAQLVRRLIPGELRQPDLFFDLLQGLKKMEQGSIADLPNAELLIVFRLLHLLGYVEGQGNIRSWLRVNLWSELDWHLAPAEIETLTQVVNHGLTHSQL